MTASAREARTRLAPLGLLVLAVCAAGASVAGCSSKPGPAEAVASAGPTPTAFNGGFISLPDDNGSVTRLSFDDDGTYVQATYPCDTTSAPCVDRGTFTVSAALDSITWTSASTGKVTTTPVQVLDRENDDARNGDDDDDDAATTTAKALVTSHLGDDAGASDDDAGANDTGVVLVTGASLKAVVADVASFTLKGTAGSRLFTHESPVEDQDQTENCWIYSTMGWADALANYASPGKVHTYSEAYTYYWDLYDQLTNSEVVLVSSHYALTQGANWGHAAHLASRYGMMARGTFVTGGEAGAAEHATAAINASLKNGPLRTRGATANHALVRSELDKAFQLPPASIQALDDVFGASVSRTFETTATPTSSYSIFRTADVPAELTQGYQDLSVGLLNQSIGTPDPTGAEHNTGTYAWSALSYPVAQGVGSYETHFQTLRRILQALNDGFPVPIDWYADGDSYRSDGSFQKAGDQAPVPGTSRASRGGYHLSLIADYEVDNVPGYGTLYAGTARTQAQKDAALADGVQVRFLRIKNSWGTSSATNYQGAEQGYNDLYLSYLDGTVHVCDTHNTCNDDPAFIEAILPKGY